MQAAVLSHPMSLENRRIAHAHHSCTTFHMQKMGNVDKPLRACKALATISYFPLV